jgi:hypothetical protein
VGVESLKFEIPTRIAGQTSGPATIPAGGIVLDDGV